MFETANWFNCLKPNMAVFPGIESGGHPIQSVDRWWLANVSWLKILLGRIDQWIGLRDFRTGKPPYLMNPLNQLGQVMIPTLILVTLPAFNGKIIM